MRSKLACLVMGGEGLIPLLLLNGEVSTFVNFRVFTIMMGGGLRPAPIPLPCYYSCTEFYFPKDSFGPLNLELERANYFSNVLGRSVHITEICLYIFDKS